MGAYGRFTAERARNAKWRKKYLPFGIIGTIILISFMIAFISSAIIFVIIIAVIYGLYFLINKNKNVVLERIVKRKPRHVYYVNSEGDIYEKYGSKTKIIKKKAVKIEQGYLYYIDKKGNLCKRIIKVIKNEL